MKKNIAVVSGVSTETEDQIRIRSKLTNSQGTVSGEDTGNDYKFKV